MSSFEKWNEHWWQRSEEEGTKQAILEAAEQNFPRPEYASGDLKLQYRHEFSTGHTLEVSENKKGLVGLMLKMPNGMKIDLTQEVFIPTNLKLITPTYAKTHKLDDEWSAKGHWRAGEDYIAVGDMKNAESVFALLHELGHVQPELKEKLKALDTKGVPEPTIAEAKYQSANERGAWSEALHIVRDIKQKYRINLMEIFPSVADFHAFMLANLTAHRYRHEFEIAEGGKELLDDPEIKEYLRTLFDRPTRLKQEQEQEDLKQAA